jgi:dTDP-4-dehydrorhamnose reductase
VGNTNFFRSLYENLQSNRPIQAFTDEYRTPLSGQTAAQGLRRLLDWALSAYKKHPDTWELGRLIQFAGTESISRYDLALQIAQHLELSTDLIQKSLRLDAENGHLRPADVSLSGDLAKQLLGFEPKSLAEQLAEMPKK